MKKIIGLGLGLISILTLSSCDLRAYELDLNYEERMAYSLYSASSMLTTTENMDVNNLSFNEPSKLLSDDPVEDYLIQQLDYYYIMFEKYLGKAEESLAAIEIDTDLVEGYAHSFNFMIDSVNYHVVYNELDNEVTDEVGDLEGIMYIQYEEEQIVLDIEGVTNSEDNKDHLHVKASSGNDNVYIKFKDGDNGSSYKFNALLNGNPFNMSVKTMYYSGKSGVEVVEYVDGIKNTFKFMSFKSDGVIKHKSIYDVYGEKGTILVSIDLDNTITYDISEGKRKGHQHQIEDKRNDIFKYMD